MPGSAPSTGRDAKGQGIRPRDVAMFVAELAVYAAVALAGWRIHPGASAGMVLLMMAWWGNLHAPRARTHLPRPIDLSLRVLWFGIGVACLVYLLVR